MATWADDGFYDTDFQIHCSRHYHEKFRGCYERIHKLIIVASAISSTSAFFLLLASSTTIATILTAVVGAVSIIDLLLDFDKKSRLHDELRRRFTELAAERELLDATDENLRLIRSKMLKIEGDEPPRMLLISLQARNAESRSRGCSEEDMAPLSWLQRVVGYFWTYGERELEDWKAERERLRATNAG